jgi:signal transduction histidine kinase
MLENTFQRLAIDFFRPKSQFGEDFSTTREQINEEAEILKSRSKDTKIRRAEFKTSLDAFFARIERGEPSKEAAQIRELVRKQLDQLTQIPNAEKAAKALLKAEADWHLALASLERSITVERPRGVGLTKALNSDWVAYQANVNRIRRDVLEPLKTDIEEWITEAASGDAVRVDRHRRAIASLDQKQSEAQAEFRRLRKEVDERAISLAQRVNEILRRSGERLQGAFRDILVEVDRADTSKVSEADLFRLQGAWEARADRAARDIREFLGSLRDQLSSLTRAVSAGTTLDVTTAALESEVESLRDQLELYAELAQAGMAVGIVQHEFANTVRTVREAISRLEPWGSETPELKKLHRTLQDGFDHLDSYLSLFTPLSRRLNRTAIDLSGEEIRNYLIEVFAARLDEERIQLQATAAFLDRIIHAFPSVILPAFVNLVDNAIYWISSDPESVREILLDAGDDAYLVTNGGPGIPLRIAERIFEFGQSTKPGGRGMGLYLSQQALRSQGFNLELRSAGENEWPVFAITIPESEG